MGGIITRLISDAVEPLNPNTQALSRW